jgi:hypothetical protein
MKPVGMISAAALLLLLGAVAPAHAMQDQHEPEAKPEKQSEAKPPKQEQPAKQENQPEAKPAKQEPQAKPVKQQQAKAAKPAPQAKPEKQEQAKAVKSEREAKPEKQQQAKVEKPAHEQQAKAGNGQRPERTAAQEQHQRSVPALRLSARGSGRIPDDRFRSNFGEGHTFVINEPVMVDGYSRFQYSGFWFGFVQPWPDGWYYTDQVYVDYIDGEYFLINPYYPGARVGISVIL